MHAEDIRSLCLIPLFPQVDRQRPVVLCAGGCILLFQFFQSRSRNEKRYFFIDLMPQIFQCVIFAAVDRPWLLFTILHSQQRLLIISRQLEQIPEHITAAAGKLPALQNIRQCAQELFFRDLLIIDDDHDIGQIFKTIYGREGRRQGFLQIWEIKTV